MSARKKPTRLRPVEALAGGGGRYRYREVRPDPKAEHGNPKYLTLQGCVGCGYHVCSCPQAEPSRPEPQGWSPREVAELARRCNGLMPQRRGVWLEPGERWRGQ